MNPVLIKPSSDPGAEVIIHGEALTSTNSRDYHDYKPAAPAAVLEPYERLLARYQVVIAEGAGSPAEINLRDNDIANTGFAEAVDCPVIIVADIDRGGVFAHLVGTLELLSESERNRVVGFAINRFRGDLVALCANGWERDILRHLRYGGKVLGICGGFQMLGQEIADPGGIEGEPGTSSGLSLLDMTSQLSMKNSCDRPVALCVWPTDKYPLPAMKLIAAGRSVQHSLILLPGSAMVSMERAAVMTR